ncbi:hypothetical protein [Paraflavitalea speifideaquila]|uniref:hypothetical protein n=1 Tax=Paraflavitalea speifideaquila TaxID=3076558 RepID=UPI0028F13A67|nr:hypothetical protein [Paraflavitalea speifideiaquila]
MENRVKYAPTQRFMMLSCSQLLLPAITYFTAWQQLCKCDKRMYRNWHALK